MSSQSQSSSKALSRSLNVLSSTLATLPQPDSSAPVAASGNAAGGVAGEKKEAAKSGSRSNLLGGSAAAPSGTGRREKELQLGKCEPSVNGNLKSRWQKEEASAVHSIKFSPDDEYVATGLGNGTIQVYQAKTGNIVYALNAESELQVPCTALVWRPNTDGPKTKNVVVAVYPDGQVIHWHATTGKILSRLNEGENQIFAIDYFHNGSMFVTSGSDCLLRLYDETTSQVKTKLFAGFKDMTAGHSNRVFSVKFHPHNPNLLISGGWDNTVQVWDVRAEYSVRSIFKPHICGDSIDFDETGEKILTGAYMKEDPLNLWSYAHGSLLESIQWSVLDDKKTCLLYSAMFSKGNGKGNKFIVAGGGGTAVNEAKVFNYATRRCVGYVTSLPSAVFSVNMSHNDKLFAIGGAFKGLHVYDVDTGYNQELVY